MGQKLRPFLWEDLVDPFRICFFFGVRVMGRGRAISKNLQLSNHSPKLTKSIPTQKSWVPCGQPWHFRSFTISQKSSTKRWGRIASRVSSTQTWWLTRQDLFFWWGTCGTVERSTLYSHHQPLVGWVCFHRVQPLVGWVCFEEQGGPALLTFNHGFNRWKNSTLAMGWNPSC